MRLALAQMHMRNNLNENYKSSLSFIEQASSCDVLLFPRLQLTPYFPMYEGIDASAGLSRLNDARIKGMEYQAGKHGLYISANVYMETDGRRYNTGLWFDRNGSSGPMSGMRYPVDMEGMYQSSCFAPWKKEPEVYTTGYGKVGVVIGSDRHDPASIRICRLKGASLVLIPCAVYSHEDMNLYVQELCAAAYQNRVFIALCNRTGKEGAFTFSGKSVVVGPDGRVIEQADQEEGLLKVNIDLKQADEVRKEYDFLSYVYKEKQA